MPELTRAELIRLYAAHAAAADAVEADLKNRALDEYEQEGTAVSWRHPGTGLVTTNLAHDGAVVSDEEAFLDWLEEHTAAVQRIEVRSVPGEFRKRFLLEEVYPVVRVDMDEDTVAWRVPVRSELVKGARFPVFDKATNALVPGVTYVHGGSLHSISLKLDSALTKAARQAAARYADGELSFTELLDQV